MMGNRLLQVGSDKGLDDDSSRDVLFAQDLLFQERFDPIVYNERTDLVSAQESHFAGGSTESYAHPIAIGISRHHEFGSGAIGLFDGQFQGFGILRVWRFDRW